MNESHNRANLENKRFGILSVIKYTRTSQKSAYWLCQCDCGNFCEKSTYKLTGINYRPSCGCLKHKKSWNNKCVGEITGLYWAHLKAGAKQRGIEVNLTMEEAWAKFIEQNRRCAFSGIELCFPKNWKDKNQTASIDRKDSNKPYEKDNIQWIHKTINKMKNVLSDYEFVEWCKLITIHRGNNANNAMSI